MIVCVCVMVCVCVWSAYVTVHMWRAVDNFVELALSLHLYVGSKDGTWFSKVTWNIFSSFFIHYFLSAYCLLSWKQYIHELKRASLTLLVL